MVRLALATTAPFWVSDIALGTFLIVFAGFTDIVDGVVARKLNCTTHTGAFVDGWTDKIFTINTAWSLVVFDYLSPLFAILLCGREWVQIPMVPYYVQRYVRGWVPLNRPHWSGKLASVSVFVCFVASLDQQTQMVVFLSIVACCTGLHSALIYVRREFVE